MLDLIAGIIDLEVDRHNIAAAGVAARHSDINQIQRAVITRILIMIEQKFDSFLAIHGFPPVSRSQESEYRIEILDLLGIIETMRF